MMAVKYFCDRCEKEISPTDKWFLRHESYYHSLSIFHNEAKKDEHIVWTLCPECGDKFIEWFNHPFNERFKEGTKC